MSTIEKDRNRMNCTTKGLAEWMGVAPPQHLMRAVLAALSQGSISEAVDQFDESFTFNDRALGLEFVDKERLREFFAKSRQLFPDTALEVITVYEVGDTAFSEWRLTATWPTYYVSVPLQLPISLRGASIAKIQNGRIRSWSDYYDEKSSWRLTLASYFMDRSDY